MGRWRPPSPQSSPYITAEGFRAMQAELKELWERRAEVVKHLAAAAAEGDRSENAEYIYRKKELRELDHRIGYLQRRLPVLKVIAETPADPDRVFFGAFVELESPDGSRTAYRIVGADETDAERGDISVDSPMARALLKKTFDEELVVQTAEGTMRYTIIDIRYES
jgi:transcription elongation factor GreB